MKAVCACLLQFYTVAARGTKKESEPLITRSRRTLSLLLAWPAAGGGRTGDVTSGYHHYQHSIRSKHLEI